MDMIYFDYNATAPLLPAARRAWIDAAEQFIGNPSSSHRLGARAEAALTGAREWLAGVLGCDPLDVVWTSGATESNNMVFHHLRQKLDHRAEAGVTAGTDAPADIWISAIEHPSVQEVAAHYFPGHVRLIPADHSGVVKVEWLRRELALTRPALLGVMAANNETGVLQPWREVLALCRSWHVPFFCDAAQWLGKLPARGLGDSDFVSGCAHKFGGPRGVGFLKCPPEGTFYPLLLGGKQEEGRRAGTENVAGVLAMIKALEECEASLASNEQASRMTWRQDFERRLQVDLPGAIVVGAGQPSLWNTVSVMMPEAHSQHRWVVKLDKLGFAVSTGSACASGREEPSSVLVAMGFSREEAGRALRFSSGWETTAAEWDALAEALVKVHQDLIELR